MRSRVRLDCRPSDGKWFMTLLPADPAALRLTFGPYDDHIAALAAAREHLPEAVILDIERSVFQ